ncbi:hypothetical protein RXV86_09560 [Alisedimentitalea sp. MJ-SS2]|uniref:hypothetical protein n=1 Tax=Aliisedimentitalea sp. MJ-SS2 TaxID=3049795 RepID=UPI0029074547|nr:hypothetical protein [Alisedimentitalea sp. MJ-SS2]MDU8927630.1 hypothetical protein [Alisedimentitalea sp. MJ-SS2]
MIDASGNVTLTYQSIVETPLRTVSGTKGGAMTPTIDETTWTDPNPITGNTFVGSPDTV